MPKLTHPESGGTFEASARTVEHWLSRGWQLATETTKRKSKTPDVPPTPENDPTPAAGNDTEE